MSPCQKICQLDSNMWYCTTCFRTVNEISNWLFYTDDQKCAIMKDLEERKSFYESDQRFSGDE